MTPRTPDFAAHNHKTLISPGSLCWPGPRRMPIIRKARPSCGHRVRGQNHYTTTNQICDVVAFVVGYFQAITTGCAVPLQHYKNLPRACDRGQARVYAGARAPMRETYLYFCSFVVIKVKSLFRNEKSHYKTRYKPTTEPGFPLQIGLHCGFDQASETFKPLKLLEKGGFCYGKA